MTPEVPVTISVGRGDALDGDLAVPDGAIGLVLFAHGSGSSRSSPRNRFVAERLQRAGLATLLTAEEEAVDRRSAEHRFDIGLLAERLEQIADWAVREAAPASASLGLFGASTGAGAALLAAARRPGRVSAVVSRGGRPDLAGSDLADVTAPTLLIVGSRDPQVLELNRTSAEELTAECHVKVVDGATHLFEEPGALERVADLAADWFTHHLTAGSRTRGDRPRSATNDLRTTSIRRSLTMVDTEHNISGTRMTCTNPDCGCELEIVTPCPHGTSYTCACGHQLAATRPD